MTMTDRSAVGPADETRPLASDSGAGGADLQHVLAPADPVPAVAAAAPADSHGDGDGTPEGPSLVSTDRWNTLRPVITKLYKEENRTLKETMEIMERDHQFFATARMYKTRIKNWGLDKKFKADEVLVMLHAKKGREVVNKSTEFVVRGRKVDPRRMKRYLQRNKTVLGRFDAGEAPGPSNNQRVAAVVQVRTPSPEPRPSMSTATSTTSLPLPPPSAVASALGPYDQSQSETQLQLQPVAHRHHHYHHHHYHHHYHHYNEREQQQQHQHPLPEPVDDGRHSPSLGLPGPVREEERLLHGLRSYIGGSFGAGTWYFDPFGRLHSKKGQSGEALLLDVWTRFEVVASGMATAEDVKVFGTLNPAFESLQEVVREEAPLLMSRVLRLSRKLQLLGNRQLWLVLLNYIDCQTDQLLGSNHILRRIWRQLLELEVGAREELLDRAYMIIVSEFDRSCHSAVNFGVLEAYRDHFDTVSSPSRRRNLEAQETTLRRTLSRVPPQALSTLPILGLRLRLRITTSLICCERGELAAAETILSERPDLHPSSPSFPWPRSLSSLPIPQECPLYEEFAPLGPWAVASQHGAMGHVMMVKGDMARAETCFTKAVDHVEKATGYSNESCYERMLANLERLYTFTGQHAEATVVRRRRLLRLLENARLREEAAAAAADKAASAAAAATVTVSSVTDAGDGRGGLPPPASQSLVVIKQESPPFTTASLPSRPP